MSDSYHSETSDSSEGGDVGENGGAGGGAGVGAVAAPAGNNNTQNSRTDRQWRLMNTATMRILGKVSSQILSLNSSYNLLVLQRPN
jgi:hypothetical protein